MRRNGGTSTAARRIMIAAVVMAAGFLTGACAEVREPRLAPAWGPADAAQPISHARAVELAVQSAPTAAAWRARLIKARAALRGARQLPNPHFNASWEDFGLYRGATLDPLQQTFSLAYALSDLLAQPYRERAARWDLESEHARITAEIQSLAADVCHAYDDTVAAERRVAAEQDLEHIAADQAAAAGRLAEAGVQAGFAAERAEADLAKARADLATSRSDAREKELALAFALGFDQPVELVLSEGLTPAPHAGALTAEHLLTQAALARSELRAADAHYQAELERLRLESRRLKFLPTLGFGGRTVEGDARGVASIDVELPVFEDGSADEQAQRSELLAAAADARLAAHQVASDVHRSRERLLAARSFLDEHARALASRRTALRERGDRLFAAGELTFEDLVQLRRDEVEARRDLLDAESAVSAAAIDLQRATGTMDTPAPTSRRTP